MGRIFANKARADAGRIEEDAEKKKNKRKIAFALVGTIIIVAAMGAYVYEKYGTFTLHPGEHYIVNIPFIGASNNPVIEGHVTYTNGTPIENINVTVKCKKNKKDKDYSVSRWDLTDENGYYKIILPEINTSKEYCDVYVGYNNTSNNTTNLTLASNGYTLNLDADKKVYNKSTDKVVVITGTIDNEDARIENGRMDVYLKYKGNKSTWKSAKVIFNKRYYINAEPQESYPIPNEDDGVNITWQIPFDASIGEYRFEVKPSFNAKEPTKPVYVYFNVTE